MGTNKFWIHLIGFFLFCFVFSSCVKENSSSISQPKKDIYLTVSFTHLVKGDLVIFDTLMYATSLGNQYMITDLQYFISGIRLHLKGGKWFDINPDHEIHYIDAHVSNADKKNWTLSVLMPEGEADSISFVFGLDAENNISYRFPDPPERDMFWPEVLGGGYHYMKMNLKWKDPGISEQKPFMFHLGIGQMYTGNTINPDSIIGYIQNYFLINLPLTLKIGPETSKPSCTIIMNIEKWFDGPYAFDFADYPKGIMQNQDGMFKGCKNGRQAFIVKAVNGK